MIYQGVQSLFSTSCDLPSFSLFSSNHADESATRAFFLLFHWLIFDEAVGHFDYANSQTSTLTIC